MHAALAIDQLGAVVERDDRAVPDVGMDVQAGAAVVQEGRELVRRDIVAGQRQRHDEPLVPGRIEELAAVGMVVSTPDQGALALRRWPLRGGFLRPVAPAEQVAVTDRAVAGVERLAAPPRIRRCPR